MQRMPRTPSVVRALLATGGLAAAFGLSACSVKQRDADQIAGKQAFVQKCGSCHVLSRAGTKGITGPNLDAAFRQSLADGLGTDGVRGIVRKQIAYPSRPGQAGTGIMPANLARGAKADDIAAYVASVVAKPGEDKGLLGSAVKKAGGGKPYTAKAGTLEIDADPGGALSYTANKATAGPGPLKIVLKNTSGVQHDIVIDKKGKTNVIQKGTADFSADYAPGTYTFYCSIPGHRAAGMQGTLTIK